MDAQPANGSRQRPAGGVHIGRRLHYRLAADLVDRDPRRVVLMQRSSTLLLGPETGWHHEADFYQAAWRSVERGTTWFHIASLPGIRRHLLRTTSIFPDTVDAASRMEIREGTVCLPRAGGDGAEIRLLPEEGLDIGGEDFKFDRQARLIAADFGDSTEALVVSDIGERQVTMHLEGAAATSIFDLATSFYRLCPALQIEQLDWLPGATGAAPGRSAT